MDSWGRAVAPVVSGRRLSRGRGSIRGALLVRAGGLGRGWTMAPGLSFTDGEVYGRTPVHGLGTPSRVPLRGAGTFPGAAPAAGGSQVTLR